MFRYSTDHKYSIHVSGSDLLLLQIRLLMTTRNKQPNMDRNLLVQYALEPLKEEEAVALLKSCSELVTLCLTWLVLLSQSW